MCLEVPIKIRNTSPLTCSLRQRPPGGGVRRGWAYAPGPRPAGLARGRCAPGSSACHGASGPAEFMAALAAGAALGGNLNSGKVSGCAPQAPAASGPGVQAAKDAGTPARPGSTFWSGQVSGYSEPESESAEVHNHEPQTRSHKPEVASTMATRRASSNVLASDYMIVACSRSDSCIHTGTHQAPLTFPPLRPLSSVPRCSMILRDDCPALMYKCRYRGRRTIVPRFGAVRCVHASASTPGLHRQSAGWLPSGRSQGMYSFLVLQS